MKQLPYLLMESMSSFPVLEGSCFILRFPQCSVTHGGPSGKPSSLALLLWNLQKLDSVASLRINAKQERQRIPSEGCGGCNLRGRFSIAIMWSEGASASNWHFEPWEANKQLFMNSCMNKATKRYDGWTQGFNYRMGANCTGRHKWIDVTGLTYENAQGYSFYFFSSFPGLYTSPVASI